MMLRFPKELWEKVLKVRDKYLPNVSVEDMLIRATKYYLKKFEM